MKEKLILAKDTVKLTIKKNATKLSLAATGIATLGATYLLGKTHGTQTLVVNIATKDEEGNIVTNQLPELK